VTAPASYWPGALRAALVEQLLGPRRRWRSLRNLSWLVFTIALTLAIPWVDRWQTGSLPFFMLVFVPTSSLMAANRERLLRRSKNRQATVFTAAVIAQAAAFIGFVVVSVRFGPEPWPVTDRTPCRSTPLAPRRAAPCVCPLDVSVEQSGRRRRFEPKVPRNRAACRRHRIDRRSSGGR
jgi:hypothetical protein